jgi:hypothetical protein
VPLDQPPHFGLVLLALQRLLALPLFHCLLVELLKLIHRHLVACEGCWVENHSKNVSFRYSFWDVTPQGGDDRLRFFHPGDRGQSCDLAEFCS